MAASSICSRPLLICSSPLSSWDSASSSWYSPMEMVALPLANSMAAVIWPFSMATSPALMSSMAFDRSVTFWLAKTALIWATYPS